MDAERLEEEAKKARRLADIAKHTPLMMDRLDEYGHEICERTCHAQINLGRLAIELQNAYAAELQALWGIIKILRAEALYWRAKCEGEIDK